MRRAWLCSPLLLFAACGGSSGGGDGGLTPDGTVLQVDDAGRVIDAAPGADSSTVLPGTGFWPQATIDVSGASFIDPMSATIISNFKARGGFGNGNKMKIEFSIQVLRADATAPMRTFTPTSNFFQRECDLAAVPVPLVGQVEGSLTRDYSCPKDSMGLPDGDCHLIVIHEPSNKLYEMWVADISGSPARFTGGCLAIWDMNRVYPLNGRGERCTSADAAGYPIAPLLFTADEVAAGRIDHAIRFILPNSVIQRGSYRHPATHATDSTMMPGVIYGTRLRLKNDPSILTRLPNEGARVVARALQKYGMFLADGGNDALTAAHDRFSTAKWGRRDQDDYVIADDPNRLLGPLDLYALTPDDFEVVKAPDSASPIIYNAQNDTCVRNCWVTADCTPVASGLTCQGATGATPGTCQ